MTNLSLNDIDEVLNNNGGNIKSVIQIYKREELLHVCMDIGIQICKHAYYMHYALHTQNTRMNVRGILRICA